MARKVFGRATVTVNGQQLLINRDASINVGGVTRHTVKGDTVHGFAEEAMESVVEIQVTVTDGASLKAWGAIDNATVIFETDTGQTFQLPNAWVQDPPEATGGEGGRVPLRFVSATCREF